MSIKLKLFLVFTGFVLLIGSSIGVTIWTVNSQKSDGIVISLAGRQSLLPQQITKDTLAIGLGMESARENLLRTAETFDSTLAVLINGGSIEAGEGEVTLPPTRDAKIHDQLIQVKSIWDEFYKKVKVVIDKDSDLPALAAAAKFIERNNLLLLSETRRADEMYTIAATKRIRLLLVMEIIFFLATVFMAGIGWSILIRYVVTPINGVVSFAQTIAKGDLRQQMEIKTRDEIGILGENLNHMASKLKEMADEIRRTSEGIVEATDKIDADALTKGTEEQVKSTEVTSEAIGRMNMSIKGIVTAAESLSQSACESSSSILEMTSAIDQIAQSANNLNTVVEDTSSFITEMSSSIKQIDENVEVLFSSAENTASAISEMANTIKGIEENVNESARLTEDVKKEASELGMKAIDKTVKGMDRIMKSVEASGLIIDRLGERSQHIGEVLTVIDEVTRQTNLIALNAAIIAAQAGEHGKGFNVVADEIKALAERTEASTKEIAQMIVSIQKEAGEAVKSMKESSENVTAGIELSKEAANALEKIFERSDRSAKMSKEIESATKEQRRGIVQVSEEVHKITNMVKEIARATQEQREGSEQINDSVEKMKDISRQVRQATIEQTKGSQQINEAVENVNHKVSAIVKATKEQSIGSEQVVTSVENIRDIAQENIESFSNIKENIEYLITQAERLDGEVKRFIL